MPLPSLDRTCRCAAVAEDTRIDVQVVADGDVDRLRGGDRVRAPTGDLVGARGKVTLPGRGSEIDPVDDHPKRLAAGRVHGYVSARRLRGEWRRVDDRLAVRLHVGVADERQEAGFRDAHLVRTDGHADQRCDRRRSDRLAVERHVGSRLLDVHGERAGLRGELLQSGDDGRLVGARELGAVRALGLGVRVERLGAATERVERVGHPELCVRGGRGRKRGLVMGESSRKVLCLGGFVAGARLRRCGCRARCLTAGRTLRADRRAHRGDCDREEQGETAQRLSIQDEPCRLGNSAGRRQSEPRGGST